MGTYWETVGLATASQSMAATEILKATFANNTPLDHFLEAALAANEPVLLLVNDPHRPTLTRPVLTALSRHITSAAVPSGVPRPRFRVLVATGTHRFSAEERHDFEQATFAECGLHLEDVAWHDASDAGSLATVAGLSISRCVAQSRFLLPIGSAEPHYFAGVTGPHKTITIGCLSRDGIEANHANALSPASEILRLHGNPVFDGIVATLQQLKSAGKNIHAICEVVGCGALIAAATGEPVDVVEQLLPTMREVYVQTIPKPVDILWLQVPPPLGCTLYQADKALKNNHLAVRDGGVILLEADCRDGVGIDAFMGLLRRTGDFIMARQLVADEGYRLGDHKAVKLRHLTDPACRGVHVALVSAHLSESELRDTGIPVFSDADQGLAWAHGVVDQPLDLGLRIEEAGMVTVKPTPG